MRFLIGLGAFVGTSVVLAMGLDLVGVRGAPAGLLEIIVATVVTWLVLRRSGPDWLDRAQQSADE